MSFRNRLALFLMVTLVCVQAATAIFAYTWLRSQLVEQGKRELSAAMQSFTRQLDFISQRATDGVQVLALDYAFRAAIAKSDHDTELSVLRNHGHRIGAARMMLVTLNGSIAADTAQATRAGAAFPYPSLLQSAAARDRGTALITLGNSIYWIVVVPVRAPIPIAFVAACIPLDDGLVEQMRRISSSPHAIVLATRAADGRWRVAAHTHGDGRLILPAIGNGAGIAAVVTQRESGTLAIVAPLRAASGSHPIVAVIYFPLAEALRAYRGLIVPMLLVLGLALFAAAGGAALIVRRLSRPLEALASAAQRIAAGDYAHAPLTAASRDEVGHLTQAIATMTRAIAEREAALIGAMEAAELARVEAVKANDAKSQFLANMSHELRTPLNAVIGFSNVMQQQMFGPMPDRYREYSKVIEESGTHLLTIINSILDLTRAEASQLTLNEQEVEIADVVAFCEQIIRVMAQRADVAFVPDIDEGLPHVFADPTKLQQILINLLSNAIKFTPPSGTVTLTVGLDAGGDLMFRIEDTGIGIPADKIELALAPFGQVDSRLARKYDGVGLGLPLAKILVELHGGKLEIDSEVDAGTVVTVRIPRERLRAREAVTVGNGTAVTIELPLAAGAIGHAA